jgi:predicted nucleic acid-binding protein
VLVIDTSVAAAWWFQDEVTQATDAVLEQVVSEGAVVPALFPAEAANVLVQAERRKRIAPALVDRMLGILNGLPIEVEASPRVPGRALDLARAHGLTVYDAMYLEAAIRRGLPLATLDGDLRRAARAAGVALVL